MNFPNHLKSQKLINRQIQSKVVIILPKIKQPTQRMGTLRYSLQQTNVQTVKQQSTFSNKKNSSVVYPKDNLITKKRSIGQINKSPSKFHTQPLYNQSQCPLNNNKGVKIKLSQLQEQIVQNNHCQSTSKNRIFNQLDFEKNNKDRSQNYQKKFIERMKKVKDLILKRNPNKNHQIKEIYNPTLIFQKLKKNKPQKTQKVQQAQKYNASPTQIIDNKERKYIQKSDQSVSKILIQIPIEYDKKKTKNSISKKYIENLIANSKKKKKVFQFYNKHQSQCFNSIKNGYNIKNNLIKQQRKLSKQYFQSSLLNNQSKIPNQKSKSQQILTNANIKNKKNLSKYIKLKKKNRLHSHQHENLLISKGIYNQVESAKKNQINYQMNKSRKEQNEGQDQIQNQQEQVKQTNKKYVIDKKTNINKSEAEFVLQGWQNKQVCSKNINQLSLYNFYQKKQ